MKKLLYISIIILIVFYSCDKFFDVEPETVLTEEKAHRNKYDADAIVKGIYGKLLYLAPQYVILNELRADLMDITENADHYLREVNFHNVKPGNPYTNPKLFFSLINDCNDALYSFNKMYKELKINRDVYIQHYSNIGALRSWLYLQLAIHYGKVPYITFPITNVSDLSKIDSINVPVLSLDVMIDTLINFVEKLPYKDLYTLSSMTLYIDGYNPRLMYIDKDFLLGDLYLWKGYYTKAAACYKKIMERNTNVNIYDSYKIPYAGDPYNLDKYNSGYVRYFYQDVNSALNHWPWMFSEFQTTNYYGEWIWVLYFDDVYPPQNLFLEYFSNIAGNYVFKPSEVAIENWNEQIQSNGFPGDFRGEGGSYQIINGQKVITKYIANYSKDNPFDKSGKWFLKRAGELHIRFAEAANRDGKYKLAYSLINNGIRSNYDGPGDDKTNLQRTLDPPPYDFDARMTTGTQLPLNYRGLYHRNTGIRGRVYLRNFQVPNGEDSLIYIENKIIEEASLELAYEGQRWGDLVRIALRRNDPSFLADKIYQKLLKSGYPGAAEVREKLLNKENWFLPLK